MSFAPFTGKSWLLPLLLAASQPRGNELGEIIEGSPIGNPARGREGEESKRKQASPLPPPPPSGSSEEGIKTRTPTPWGIRIEGGREIRC